MARVLYFDCFSGISGDMALGAMLDAGLPLDDLKSALGSLAVSGFDVSGVRVLRAGVSATKFTLHEHGGAQHDHGHHTHRRRLNITMPRGGRTKASDCGRPWASTGWASTPPRLPWPLPP